MADQALEARGVTVLPDILTNAGGWCVTWSGYRAFPCFGMSSVNREMEALMVQAYHQVISRVEGAAG